MSSNEIAALTQIKETHTEGRSYVFTWVANNLKFDPQYPSGKFITSPSFHTDYGLYQLKLYPSGSYYQDYVFLATVSEQISRGCLHSVISLVNRTGEEYFHKLQIISTNSAPIEKFVKKSDITSDFLPNGYLTIKWRLYFYISAKSFESSPTIQSMQNLAETRRLAVLDDFEKLLKDSRFSDIKIVVGTQEFFAHKNILAARSRYFAAMFESNMKEVKEGEIHITDISANIMQEILRFIYTGKINVEMTMVVDLLIVADMYGLDGLIKICEEAIIRNMSLENIGSILTHIERLNNAEKLKDSAIEFLMKNAKELSGNESFKKVLDSLSPSFVVEIMNIMMSKM